MKQTGKRFLAALLCLCLLAGLLPAAYAAEPDAADESSAYYHVASQKVYAISPGVTEKRIVLNNASGTDQNICYVLKRI